MRLIAIDTETTSVRPDADLLTAYFGVYDNRLKLVDELELTTKPDSGLYTVDPRALEVNHIDLVEHSKEAITYKEAKPILYNFLFRNNGEGHLIPLGHGVEFDIGKITNTIISQASWESFVGYRKLDTATIAQFLQMVGKLPKNIEAGLGKLAAHFQIPWVGEAHTAKSDVLMTVEVFKELIKIAK